MDASVQKVSVVRLKPICVMHCADSRSLVMVTAKFFLSMYNVLCHRSCSPDVICNVLEKNVCFSEK